MTREGGTMDEAVLHQAIRDASKRPGGEDHPDDLAMARSLEGRLDEPSRRALEAHLAECPDCRAEWVAARGVMAELEAEASSRSWLEAARSWWSAPAASAMPALAGVAALLLVVAAAVLLTRLGGAPQDPFAPFMADEADLVRAVEAGGVEPLAPSFVVVETRTPTFEWASVQDATDYRLLLIDAQEQVVGVLEQEATALTADEGHVRLEYPPTFPLLEPDALYAWKVDARVDGMWVASAFVPFRVEKGAPPRSPSP